MLQIQSEEHLTLTKVTSESCYKEFHLLENAGNLNIFAFIINAHTYVHTYILLFWSYSKIIIYVIGEVEETNGINILDMDSLECDFDSNLLKIDSEELYNFNIENLSENLSNILSISDITKVHISYLYFLINLLNE